MLQCVVRMNLMMFLLFCMATDCNTYFLYDLTIINIKSITSICLVFFKSAKQRHIVPRQPGPGSAAGACCLTPHQNLLDRQLLTWKNESKHIKYTY